jgi:hypothetical protein
MGSCYNIKIRLKQFHFDKLDMASFRELQKVYGVSQFFIDCNSSLVGDGTIGIGFCEHDNEEYFLVKLNEFVSNLEKSRHSIKDIDLDEIDTYFNYEWENPEIDKLKEECKNRLMSYSNSSK